MPLAGKRLSLGWSLAVCYWAGFRGSDLVTAVAVMCAESGRYTEAYNINYEGSAQQSIDRGLFQINDKSNPDLSEAEAFDPLTNVKRAHVIYRNRDKSFDRWAAYNHGAHVQFEAAVVACLAKERWRAKIELVEEHFA